MSGGEAFREQGRAMAEVNRRMHATTAVRRRAEAQAAARELEEIRGEQARLKAECAERRRRREQTTKTTNTKGPDGDQPSHR